MHQDRDLTVFARTNWRDRRKPFGIHRADRRAHMYVVGRTGTGKSTLLASLIRADLRSGAPSSTRTGILSRPSGLGLPAHRTGDLVYFEVANAATPLAWNPLERVSPSRGPARASGMLEVFKKLWPDSWGPRLEHILRNALLCLFELPQATLADVLRLVTDERYRKAAGSHTLNPQVREFWLREYEQYGSRFRVEAIAPLQNKVGAFLADPRLRRILTAPRSSFDLRSVMDDGKTLLVNLSKGKIGEDAASLLGALLVAQIGTTGLGRADVPEDKRRDFYLYLDEFQTFATLHLAEMLSELRKYRVNLILAHQYLAQLEPEVRDAVLGNVGTIVCFRIGVQDAVILEREFAPEFEALDLTRMPNHQFAIKLMVDGATSTPFTGETLGPGA
jgi:hypothetical protein